MYVDLFLTTMEVNKKSLQGFLEVEPCTFQPNASKRRFFVYNEILGAIMIFKDSNPTSLRFPMQVIFVGYFKRVTQFSDNETKFALMKDSEILLLNAESLNAKTSWCQKLQSSVNKSSWTAAVVDAWRVGVQPLAQLVSKHEEEFPISLNEKALKFTTEVYSKILSEDFPNWAIKNNIFIEEAKSVKPQINNDYFKIEEKMKGESVSLFIVLSKSLESGEIEQVLNQDLIKLKIYRLDTLAITKGSFQDPTLVELDESSGFSLVKVAASGAVVHIYNHQYSYFIEFVSVTKAMLFINTLLKAKSNNIQIKSSILGELFFNIDSLLLIQDDKVLQTTMLEHIQELMTSNTSKVEACVYALLHARIRIGQVSLSVY